MPRPLGVGVIGANPVRGWALTAHLPALAGLPQYKLTAVATTKQDTAEATAARFDVAAAYADAAPLIDDDAVDVVVVCVRVPEHFVLVEHALKAGKHVYCEWPLAATSEQAVTLAQLADERGVVHAVGLQARSAPAINYVRDLVADGYVGDVLSCNVYAPTGSGGRVRDLATRYTADRTNGAGPLTIGTGHTVDVVCYLLGELQSVQAMAEVTSPSTTIRETGEQLDVTAPDQVVVVGSLESGAIVSVHTHNAARPTGQGFVARIFGSDGDLLLRSTGTRGVQIETLQVLGARVADGELSTLDVPKTYFHVPEPLRQQPVLDVAEAFHRFAVAVENGERFEPDFNLAVRRHHLIDAISQSASTGVRQAVP